MKTACISVHIKRHLKMHVATFCERTVALLPFRN